MLLSMYKNTFHWYLDRVYAYIERHQVNYRHSRYDHLFLYDPICLLLPWLFGLKTEVTHGLIHRIMSHFNRLVFITFSLVMVVEQMMNR